MSDRIRAMLLAVIEREGDYVDNPKDKGGKTRWGVTEAVARADGFAGDMRFLPRVRAYDILFRRYVVAPGFATILDAAPLATEELVDTFVNMGAGNREAKDGPIFWLQRFLNAANREERDYADITVDGVIGPATRRSLGAYLGKRAGGDRILATFLNGMQAARYLGITEAREANEEFFNGWLANRVAA